MVRVTFVPAGVTALVDLSKLPAAGPGRPGSLLQIALASGLPLEHSCGGACACSTCHVLIRSGARHLTPMDDESNEADLLERAPGNQLSSRLACQAVPTGTGDLEVEIPGWNRNQAREGP